MTPVLHDRTQDDRSAPKFERGRTARQRPWSKVTGICLHQTASGHLHPQHPMLLAIPAHAIVHRDGSISLLHEPTDLVYHGHGLNAQTIGIEIDCRAASYDGGPFWRSKKEKAKGLTYADLGLEALDEQLLAACWLAIDYADAVERHGGRLTTMWAHRQSHVSRTSDPGARIWQGVALPMIEALRLVDVSHLTVGNGRPIPEEWKHGT